MPSFSVHIGLGIIVGLVGWFLFHNPVLIVIGLAYALVPDMDINTSIAFKTFLMITCGYAIYTIIWPPETIVTLYGVDIPQRYFAIPPMLLIMFLQLINHREFLHSIVSSFIFSVPMLIYASWPGYFVAVVSYWTHLMLDNEFFDGILT